MEPATELRTFLIADVRDYTRFTQEHGDEAAGRLAARFAELTREVSVSHGGRVVELRGDEALVAFGSARQALRAAVELQGRFTAEMEANPSLPLRVGIGLDAGEAVPVEGGFRGAALNLASRLCSIARPGEVLASEAVTHLARRIEGLDYVERDPVALKGFAEPVRVVRVVTLERFPAAQPAGAARGAAQQGSEAGTPPASDGAASPVGVRGTLAPIGGFLGALPEARLVARDEERTRIRSAVEEVADGTGRLLLLTGEPGIGKTRLAQEVTVEARSRGFIVAAGSCFEQRQAVPFYPFLEVLATLYGAAPPGLRYDLPRRWPALARLLPDVTPEASPESGRGDEERLFRSVTDFVQTLSRTAPVLIAVDDLQWADAASLELVLELARQTRAHPVLLVATARDDEGEGSETLENTLLALHRLHLLEEIAVPRMKEEGTAALVAQTTGAGTVPGAVSRLIHARTDGNPFFVQEVVHALLDNGSLERIDGRLQAHGLREIVVPDRARAVIEQRLSRLTERTRATLREASVLGRTFSFDDLLTVTGQPEGELEQALEEGVDAGVIREAGGDAYAFQHALTQRALYDDLPSRRRRRLHLAAAEALERAGEAAEVAWHYLQADDLERALPPAIRAGDQAESIYAHSEAERLYRMAMEMIWEAEQPDAAREAEVTEKLGTVLRTVGRYEEALELLQRAAQLDGELGDREAERRTVASIALIEAYLDRPEEGLARVQSLLEEPSEDGDVRGRVALYNALTFLYIATDRLPEGLAAAGEASRLARQIGDDRLLAEAETRRGEILAMLGRYAEARRTLEEIMPLAETVEPAALTRALNAMRAVSLAAGEFEQGRRYLERAVKLAERLGNPRNIALTTFGLARTLFYLGDWQKSRELTERVISLAGPIDPMGAAVATASLGYQEALEGNSQEAATLLQKAFAAFEGIPDSYRSWFVRTVMAAVGLLEGRPRAGRVLLEPLRAFAEAQPSETAFLLCTLVEARLKAGEVSGAEELATRTVKAAATAHNRPLFAEALWIQAMVRVVQGRTDEAARLFEASVTLARSMPYPLLQGRILLAWGSMGREADTDRARLEQARDIFTRLGAAVYAARTQEALLARQA